MKAKKRRPSKHGRLLKALLECLNVYTITDTGYVDVIRFSTLTKPQAKQLIAIKQAMEKKARK
jgi:hypothetical protein